MNCHSIDFVKKFRAPEFERLTDILDLRLLLRMICILSLPRKYCRIWA